MNKLLSVLCIFGFSLVSVLSLNLDGKDSTSCAMCELLVSDVKLLVDRKFASGEIAVEAKKLCLELPTDSYKQLCLMHVTTNLGTVLSSLANNVDKTVICQTMKFCTNRPLIFAATPNSNVFKQTTKESTKTASKCEDCKTLFDDFPRGVNNETTMANLDNKLKLLFCSDCPNPGVHEKCLRSIKDAAMLVIYYERSSSEICEFLKCSNSRMEVTHVSQTNPKLCSHCTGIVADIVDYVTDKSNLGKIEEFLTSFCPILYFTSNCHSYIEKYLPLVIEYIRTEVHPTKMCTDIRLCPPITALKKPLFSGEFVPFGSTCTFCHTVLKMVERSLPLNSAKNDIVVTANKSCMQLPLHYRHVCIRFVNTYGEQIADLIVKQGSVEGICMALDLCHMNKMVEKK